MASRSTIRVSLAAAVALGWTWPVTAADRPAPPSPPVAAAEPVPPLAPTQVVVYDRVSKTSTVISHDLNNAPGIDSSSRPSISADGSVVAFQSNAALVPTDGDDDTDVYLYDAAFGQVQLVSATAGGGGSNGDSRNPSIAGNASSVAFASTSTNLTDDARLDADNTQVFTWDRLTGALTLASVATNGGAANGDSGDPSLSVDGRVVAFESTSSNFLGGDTNGQRDIFLRDLARGATIRASVRSNGGQLGGGSRRPGIAGDGGAVIFDTTQSNVVPNDTNGARDVFVRDLPPAVLVSPDPLDFGAVLPGTPVDGSVTVTSYGWTPVMMVSSEIAGTNPGDFVVAGDACATLVLPLGAQCSIAVLFIPTASGERSGILVIVDTALDSAQEVELRGGVPAPELRLEPAIGPPGIVAILVANNLPVGAEVIVEWDRGTTQPLAQPFTVGTDATATIQVLVYHHDVLGPRNLMVTAGPGGPQFPEQKIPFLVVAPQLQPPGEGPISYLNPDLQLTPIRR